MPDGFREHLVKQIGFLERSAVAYDAGYTDEALRIAVQLRVLFHDTKSSTSLMKHLGSPNVNLLSTSKPRAPGGNVSLATSSLSMVRVTMAGETTRQQHIPALGDGPYGGHFGPWPAWWNEPLYRLNEKDVTRRDIVLDGANKDGGAHVDAKLTAEYQALKDGVFAIVNFSPDGVTTETLIGGSQYADLRQMAYEVLNSPEFIALAA